MEVNLGALWMFIYLFLFIYNIFSRTITSGFWAAMDQYFHDPLLLSKVYSTDEN